MFAIEKISRVAGIKRGARKSRQRPEWRGGPFPAVAHQIFHAKRARARWMRIYGSGVAPGVPGFRFVRRAVRSPMPLRFRWKLLARPARESGRFRVAHIYRPGKR